MLNNLHFEIEIPSMIFAMASYAADRRLIIIH